eukprot:TRINITY_DN9328_c0_g2_i5.p1 TRINITY_DN9328_c0_g2~~TRINITY_DN9328_c0_g2_i5.p1  ORF type:complete len:722 (-),score=145.94 TRINITY_DN9328_c0_g2_i5:111-1982(-)
MADEAVNIGPAPSSKSYLVIDNVLEACVKTGAQAVHPGYGFLSENNRFVAKLEEKGIRFIGPTSAAMDAMGDKIHSKKLAQSAGVSVIPGFIGEVQGVEECLKIAHDIGYPVIIKPSAGGGGKGMHICWNDEEVKLGFRMAKQEAMSSFGDDRLLIERFIDKPRHIEIQVLCDAHGHGIYLNERECSIQRRNQKVLEEAPSTFLTPEVRKAMGEQAIMLCKAVGYQSAGTCEFLVDPHRNFFFLEMNTRLQVEHPVTEYITGIDLVEWMIKIAAGEQLTLQQSDVGINGWAMEARVYAEDPLRKFLPQIGKLVRYSEPTDPENKNIRVDSGVLEGSEISVYYDPLIAKVISHGQNRNEAIKTLEEALDVYLIRGVTHNITLLRDILMNPRYVSGDISTKFIPEEYPNGFSGHQLSPSERILLFSLAGALYHQKRSRDRALGNAILSLPGDYVVKFEGKEQQITVHEEETQFSVFVEGLEEANTIDLSDYPIDSQVVGFCYNDNHFFAQIIAVTPLGFKIQMFGTIYAIDVLTPREAELLRYMHEPIVVDSTNHLLSPMAGTLISLAVKEGDVVTYGQELVVIEAMKMQNLCRSQRPGKIKKINYKPGDTVVLDAIILEFEPEN